MVESSTLSKKELLIRVKELESENNYLSRQARSLRKNLLRYDRTECGECYRYHDSMEEYY